MSPFHAARVLVCSFSLISLPVGAQQTSPPTISAAALLQRSLAALANNATISDVTLSGTARRIAGSDDENAPAVLKALSTGPARVDMNLPSGSRSEVVTTGDQCLVGSWKGPDGISHSVANHNLMSDPSWFFPTFTLARLASPKYVVQYVGQESWNGHTVEHLSAQQQFNSQAPGGVPNFSRLTQMDLFLDASSLLPVRLTFNTHPDKDLGVDIPVEIVFSDYRAVGSAQIPFHIQKSLNNSLSLDFQAETVNLNGNLTAAAFSVQ